MMGNYKYKLCFLTLFLLIVLYLLCEPTKPFKFLFYNVTTLGFDSKDDDDWEKPTLMDFPIDRREDYWKACPERWGRFMKKYADHHRKAVEELNDVNRSHPHHPIIIWECISGFNCNGLGDRFPGIVTSFLFSVITGRIFFINWMFEEKVFDHPYLNLTLPQTVTGYKVYDEFWSLNFLNFSREELDLKYPEDVVGIRSARGCTWWIFNQSIHGPLLSNLTGLTSENAFTCILNALFQVKPFVVDMVNSEAQIIRAKDTITIGIHLRHQWDDAFGNKLELEKDQEKLKSEMEYYQQWFQGAEKIENHLLLLNNNTTNTNPVRHILWLLVTDSIIIRNLTKQKYGDKVITTNIKPQHVAHISTTSEIVDSLISSLAEWVLYSTCDYYVLNGISGYSRTAVGWSLNMKPVTVCVEQCVSHEGLFIGKSFVSSLGSRLRGVDYQWGL